MSNLIILVPTRLRPGAVVEMARAFAKTCTADAGLVFCVDDSPDHQDYLHEYWRAREIYPHMTLFGDGKRRRLVGTLNHYSKLTFTLDLTGRAGSPPTAIGYFGDDHRPLTPGWDARFLTILDECGTGVVWGNDLIQGKNLPTQVVMTSDIIEQLGYMAPPCLGHMYCDNFWKDLGEAIGRAVYLSDCIIEHRHPCTGAVPWDDSYRESNSVEQYSQDEQAYLHYRKHQFMEDVEKVKALL